MTVAFIYWKRTCLDWLVEHIGTSGEICRWFTVWWHWNECFWGFSSTSSSPEHVELHNTRDLCKKVFFQPFSNGQRFLCFFRGRSRNLISSLPTLSRFEIWNNVRWDKIHLWTGESGFATVWGNDYSCFRKSSFVMSFFVFNCLSLEGADMKKMKPYRANGIHFFSLKKLLPSVWKKTVSKFRRQISSPMCVQKLQTFQIEIL